MLLITAVSWIGAALLTSAIAWRAVAVLDSGMPQIRVLSTNEIASELATATTTPGGASPLPTPTSADAPTTVPTVAPSPAPSAAATPTYAQIARIWNVTGGTVSAACSSDNISLLYATPADGWRVEIERTGPERLVVEFTTRSTEIQVTASCVAGEPTHRVAEESDDSDDNHHDDGDGD